MTPCAIQLPLAIQPIAARSLRSSTNGQAGCSLRMETKAVACEALGFVPTFCCGLLTAQRRPRRRTNGTRSRRQRALSTMSAMRSRNCESRCRAQHAPVRADPAASESIASMVMLHC